MSYKHGVYISEVATGLVPSVEIESALPVVVGVAPIWKATDSAGVNNMKLCYSATEAADYFGFESTDDFGAYTLSEFFYSQFGLFSMAPVVAVNVFDPSVHKSSVTDESVTLDSDGEATAAHVGINADTLVVKDATGETTYTEDTDYTVDLATGLITRLATGSIAAGVTLKLAYDYADPSKVTSADIIGGIDVSTLKPEGLELVGYVFPMFRMLPGLIVCPKYSCDPEVAAIMAAKTTNINGHFKAMALVDVPTTGDDAVTNYANVAAYKNNNNLTDEHVVVCWPKVLLGSHEYHLSTQLAGRIAKTDAANSDIPYMSPSNKALQMTSAVLAGGEEVWLDNSMAAYLNGQGIVTALNFVGGWKAWGNRTACYPDNTDPKDTFIPVRRMFNWIGNKLVLTYWQKVDFPITKRLIQTITDSVNIWLNGLAARQYIIGGRVEFRGDENATTDLMDGIIKFHVYVTPPSPAREIDFILEYDPDYLETLFS